ncbi:ABC transporter substrate-binding protein [Streptomyces sp. TP-A0874]|uniref:ABC transporter substrate-binding protein n=1 Tax=Streptomyces sp. TP-A0874 TaxID=549819 RepID=UPI000852E2B8|nr:ABC transporter substrate-binding protein [Streptomyces sp. TP-A0874]
MRKRHQLLAVPLGIGLAAGLLAGCGDGDSDEAGSGESLVMGVSDEIISLDPAAGYDPGSWLVFDNVFQSLLSFPRGGTTPEPDAAERCGFQDSSSKVYRCTLKSGLKFSNGNKLTSEDVAFSFRRTTKIDDDNGPAVMLTSIDRIETPDPRTVIFELKHSDATFPKKIASGAGSIVDHREYRMDKLRDDGKVVGSGVYTLDHYDPRKEARFSVNSGYKGPARVKNTGLTMRFFKGDQQALKKAVQEGDVDFAYRGLAMEDIAELDSGRAAGENGLELYVGSSAEVQHLVFNMKDPIIGKKGVRKAIAHLVDRSALVRDVYKRTTEPLYSIIPAGIVGHNTAFFDLYGDRPQRDKAEAALREAGIDGKLKLTLWGTPVRYGSGTIPGLEELAQQLNASGLFDAKVESVPLDEYEKGIAAGEYGVYVKGWVPDYPDPDNFTAPFFGEENVLSNNYESADITRKLIPETAAESNRSATAQTFAKLQNVVAEDLPILPLWQGKQYAVARSDVKGLEWTLDASTVFRAWELSRGSAG